MPILNNRIVKTSAYQVQAKNNKIKINACKDYKKCPHTPLPPNSFKLIF